MSSFYVMEFVGVARGSFAAKAPSKSYDVRRLYIAAAYSRMTGFWMPRCVQVAAIGKAQNCDFRKPGFGRSV